MALRTKKRILLVLVLWTFFWPLGHFVLVKSTGVSAWKLGGWSMFCVPYKMVGHKIMNLPKNYFAAYPEDWLKMYILMRWARFVGWMRDPLPMMQRIYDRLGLEGETRLYVYIYEVDLGAGGVFATKYEIWFYRPRRYGQVRVTKKESWKREKMQVVPEAVKKRIRAAAGD